MILVLKFLILEQILGLRPQTHWLIDWEGISTLISFASLNLNKDWSKICHYLSIDNDELPKINQLDKYEWKN